MSEVVQQNVDCSCFDWRNDGLQKNSDDILLYICMYNHYYYFRACPCARINFLPRAPPPQDCHFFCIFFFSNRTNNRFQKAERLKSVDKKTLLAFLNRKGYKNKHGNRCMYVQYQYVCTRTNNVSCFPLESVAW